MLLSKKMWVGQGKNPVALMRTSWTDTNAIYVAMKGGSPSVNHGHMDVGSFIMEANGERWAMDFGMQDYNSLETARSRSLEYDTKFTAMGGFQI